MPIIFTANRLRDTCLPSARETLTISLHPLDTNHNGIWDFLELSLYLPCIVRGG